VDQCQLTKHVNRGKHKSGTSYLAGSRRVSTWPERLLDLSSKEGIFKVIGGSSRSEEPGLGVSPAAMMDWRCNQLNRQW
jgi:hypothetical protein